jgi:hypothetical protein
MLRRTACHLRLFLMLLPEVPRISARLVLPGVVLVLGVPLAEGLMPADPAAAFVTAFVVALALRLGLRVEGLIRRLAAFAPAEVAALVVLQTLVPLVLLVWLADPAWCQRVATLWSVVLAAVFLSDHLAGRCEMAAITWPGARMQAHWRALTLFMALVHGATVVANEIAIRALTLDQWAVAWALAPVVGHALVAAGTGAVVLAGEEGEGRAGG